MNIADEIIQDMYDVARLDDSVKEYLDGENGLRRRLKKYLEESCRGKPSRHQAFSALADAMNDYIIEYYSPASYKEKIRKDFEWWFTDVATLYGYSEEEAKEIFDEVVEKPIKMDIVDLIKQLHPNFNEYGEQYYVTKKDLRERYKHNFRTKASARGNEPVDKNQDRTVMNMINRLSGKGKTYYIGGQPVKVAVECIDERTNDDSRTVHSEQQKIRHYHTPNTLNPLILQANIFQVGTILEGLGAENRNNNNNIALEIAVDIWCQLSDWCKSRIEDYFGNRSEEFREFLEDVKDFIDGERLLKFSPEKELLDQASIRDSLMLFSKNGTTFSMVKYTDGDGNIKKIFNKRVLIFSSGGKEKYCFTDPNDWNIDVDKIKGEKTILDFEQIKWIER